VRQLYTHGRRSIPEGSCEETAGGVFLKGLVRKNRICDLNRGHDESDVEKNSGDVATLATR
jgi:hypothetical protein